MACHRGRSIVDLSDGRGRTFPTGVGLVEITPTNQNHSDDEVIQEYFRRYPSASLEDRRFIETLKFNSGKLQSGKVHCTTHAEATLMGLVKSFPPGSSFANHGVEIEGVEFLKQLIEPVCLLFLPPSDMYLMYKLFGCRLLLKMRSRSTKSVAGVADSGYSSVMLNCLAHMEFFILGVLLEWEWMLLFSDLLRVICGMK